MTSLSQGWKVPTRDNLKLYDEETEALLRKIKTLLQEEPELTKKVPVEKVGEDQTTEVTKIDENSKIFHKIKSLENNLFSKNYFDNLTDFSVTEKERKRRSDTYLALKRPSEITLPSPDSSSYSHFVDYKLAVRVHCCIAKTSLIIEEQRARAGDPSAQVVLGKTIVREALEAKAICNEILLRRDQWFKTSLDQE